MPRIEHEPWCTFHESNGYDDAGMCGISSIEFGPNDAGHSELDMEPTPMGALAVQRSNDDEIQVYVDYNTTWGGYMDINGLRAVREAVAGSPEEFLAALDQIIATLGDVVPKAHRQPEPAPA